VLGLLLSSPGNLARTAFDEALGEILTMRLIVLSILQSVTRGLPERFLDRNDPVNSFLLTVLLTVEI
jgi:hypothetical protein